MNESRFNTLWWKAREGKVHELLIPHVSRIESRQSDYFDRFKQNDALYDPNGPAAEEALPEFRRRLRGQKQNVIATTVDTSRATIAATEVYARFMTDGADWGTQRRAILLEQYAEQIAKLTKVGDACRAAFFAIAKKGTGIVKVYADQDKQLHVEPVMVDNIVVDNRECTNGNTPQQLHYRQHDYDVDRLVQQFPEHATAIYKAAEGGTTYRQGRRYGGNGESRNSVFVMESWYLPMGKRPDGWEEMSAADRKASRYVPGTHAICVDGADLLVEEWHKPHFGMAVGYWTAREGSWYGISLAERNTGNQNVIDKRHAQRDKQLDQGALPVTYIRPIDIAARMQTTSAGRFVPIKGDWPQTVVPTAVGPEIANDLDRALAGALGEVGLSEMAVRGTKPAGLESGAAMREFRDQATQRFSMQEKEFESLWINVIVLLLDCCKDLGDDAPELMKVSRFGPRKIPWSDIEIDDARVMIAAASTLSRTPAGRVQTVLELTQAGALNVDELRKLLDHPDLKRTKSLYTASMEAIEHDLELIAEGHAILPDPFVNLQMAQTYAQAQALIERDNGAPESVVEMLRAYAINAAEFLSRAAANTNAPTLAAGVPMPLPDPSMGGGGAPPAALPPGPPMATPQQVPSAGPPLIPAGTGPMAA